MIQEIVFPLRICGLRIQEPSWGKQAVQLCQITNEKKEKKIYSDVLLLGGRERKRLRFKCEFVVSDKVVSNSESDIVVDQWIREGGMLPPDHDHLHSFIPISNPVDHFISRRVASTRR